MASRSLRDELLNALTPEAQRYALRLHSSAGMAHDDPSWILIASAARILFPPRPPVRHQWPGWTLVLCTVIISVLSLLFAGWVGARGWTGYLQAEIKKLEERRSELQLGTPPEWATSWTSPTGAASSGLFVRGHTEADLQLRPCHVLDDPGVCILLRE